MNDDRERERPAFVALDPVEDFSCEVRTDVPIPRDLLRQARSFAREQRPPNPNDPNGVTLRSALFLASRKWRSLPKGRWKLCRQSDRAIRLLLRQGKRYVAQVNEAALLVLIDDSLAEGLSPAAVSFRLACLAGLGVAAAAKISREVIEARTGLKPCE